MEILFSFVTTKYSMQSWLWSQQLCFGNQAPVTRTVHSLLLLVLVLAQMNRKGWNSHAVDVTVYVIVFYHVFFPGAGVGEMAAVALPS